MLNVSLALSTGVALTQHRRALTRLVAQRLVIKRAELSEEARLHRDWVLSAFAQTGGLRRMERQHVVKEVLNADWRDRLSPVLLFLGLFENTKENLKNTKDFLTLRTLKNPAK